MWLSGIKTQKKAIIKTVPNTTRDGYTLFTKVNVERDLVRNSWAAALDLQGKQEKGSGIWLITSEAISLIYTMCQTKTTDRLNMLIQTIEV